MLCLHRVEETKNICAQWCFSTMLRTSLLLPITLLLIFFRWAVSFPRRSCLSNRKESLTLIQLIIHKHFKNFIFQMCYHKFCLILKLLQEFPSVSFEEEWGCKLRREPPALSRKRNIFSICATNLCLWVQNTMYGALWISHLNPRMVKWLVQMPYS